MMCTFHAESSFRAIGIGIQDGSISDLRFLPIHFDHRICDPNGIVGETSVSYIGKILFSRLLQAAHVGKDLILRDQLPHSIYVRIRHRLAIFCLRVKNGKFLVT